MSAHHRPEEFAQVFGPYRPLIRVRRPWRILPCAAAVWLMIALVWWAL